MRQLVDTCTFLWLTTDDPMLSGPARECCQAPHSSMYFGALSAWGIKIKHRLERLPVPLPPDIYIASRREWLGIEPLPFDEKSASHDNCLPHHRSGPLDRVPVAQAILHGMTIVTPDPAICIYPVPTRW